MQKKTDGGHERRGEQEKGKVKGRLRRTRMVEGWGKGRGKE
jgi:hypothetical protein